MKKSTERPYVTTQVQRVKMDVIKRYAKEHGKKIYKVIDDLLAEGMKKQRMNGN